MHFQLQGSQGRAPLILGGDGSLLVAAARALSARGRYGLVHMDGHTDFRHPGNSAERYSLAGEDLAAAVGLAQLIPGRRMREAGPAATADAILLTDILASGLQHLGADRTG